MAIWIAILLLPTMALGEKPTPEQRASASRAYYKRCPNFRYQGRHKLFRHALACSVAKSKARYVLKNGTNPPGWRCSLDNLRDGYGACARGRHAFEFLPL